MSRKKSGKTVSGVVPPSTVDEIEEYREGRQITKSQAVRELIEDGLRYQRFFERVLLQAVAIAVAGALTVVASTVVLWAVTFFGGWSGVSPYQALAVGGAVTIVLFAAAGVAWVFHLVGLGRWIDNVVNSAAEQLEARR